MSTVISLLQSIKNIKQTKPFLAFAEAHARLMGYRKQGLLFDDLIPDESDTIQEALSRLEPQQQMDRTFRIRRSLNLSLKKISLPQEEWTTPDEDVRYLEPILKQLEAEAITRHTYESLSAIPKELLARNRSS